MDRLTCRAARAFTLLEGVVTMAVIGVVMAVVFPQLTSAAALGSDQQAKMSANAALDAIATTYGRSTSQMPWQTLSISGQSTLVPPRPQVDPALVRAFAPDVAVMADPASPAQGPTQVSAGSIEQVSADSFWWRVGVAALAKGGGRTTCWLAWSDLDPPAGTAVTSRYYAFDLDSDAQLSLCTGRAASRLTAVPGPGAAEGTSESWSMPMTVTAAQMAAAAG